MYVWQRQTNANYEALDREHLFKCSLLEDSLDALPSKTQHNYGLPRTRSLSVLIS
jgi:hypothetical protein